MPLLHTRNLVTLLLAQAPNDGLDLMPWHVEPSNRLDRRAVASDDRGNLRLVAARFRLRLLVLRRLLRRVANDGASDAREKGHKRAVEIPRAGGRDFRGMAENLWKA